MSKSLRDTGENANKRKKLFGFSFSAAAGWSGHHSSFTIQVRLQLHAISRNIRFSLSLYILSSFAIFMCVYVHLWEGQIVRGRNPRILQFLFGFSPFIL